MATAQRNDYDDLTNVTKNTDAAQPTRHHDPCASEVRPEAELNKPNYPSQEGNTIIIEEQDTDVKELRYTNSVDEAHHHKQTDDGQMRGGPKLNHVTEEEARIATMKEQHNDYIKMARNATSMDDARLYEQYANDVAKEGGFKPDCLTEEEINSISVKEEHDNYMARARGARSLYNASRFEQLAHKAGRTGGFEPDSVAEDEITRIAVREYKNYVKRSEGFSSKRRMWAAFA